MLEVYGTFNDQAEPNSRQKDLLKPVPVLIQAVMGCGLVASCVTP